MSMRYVWEKYSTETEIYKVDNALYKSTFSMNDTDKYGFCGFNSYTIDGNRLYFDEPITRYYVTLENTEDNPVYVNEQFFHIEGYTLDTDTYEYLSYVQGGGLCERKSTSQKPYIYIKQFKTFKRKIREVIKDSRVLNLKTNQVNVKIAKNKVFYL